MTPQEFESIRQDVKSGKPISDPHPDLMLELVRPIEHISQETVDRVRRREDPVLAAEIDKGRAAELDKAS